MTKESNVVGLTDGSPGFTLCKILPVAPLRNALAPLGP
jgi:hypothetical protein